MVKDLARGSSNDHQDIAKEIAGETQLGTSPAAQVTPTAELYSILRRYASRGALQEVEFMATEMIKERGEVPNQRLYSALILCNVNPGSGSAMKVKALLQEMEERGILPDSILFHDALKVLAIHPDCVLRGRLLEEMRQRWITLTGNGWHDVICGLIREGQLEQALEGLEEVRRAGHQIQAWLSDMTIYALCSTEELDEALNVMQDRVAAGEVNISSSTWYYLFDMGCKLLHHDVLQYIWRARVGMDYLNPSIGQCKQVLHSAARRGDVQLATDVFKLLSGRGLTFDASHYEMLLEAYVIAGDIYTALTILCIMKKAKVLPDDRGTRSLTKHLEQSSTFAEQAFAVLQELDAQGRDVPTAAFNSVLEATIETTGLTMAIEQYKTLHQLSSEGPNTNTFNLLLRGCRSEKRKDTAMFLAAEMLALKVKPDTLTYDRLVLTCLREDDYEDAFRYYDEMKQLKMTPRTGTFNALVKRCGEAGDGRALEILDDMHSMGMQNSNLKQWLVDKGILKPGERDHMIPEIA